MFKEVTQRHIVLLGTSDLHAINSYTIETYDNKGPKSSDETTAGSGKGL